MLFLRVKLKLKNIGLFERGVSLVDDNGNYYVWYTKQWNNPLAYYKGEWFSTSATLSEEVVEGVKRNVLKNVRILNKDRR